MALTVERKVGKTPNGGAYSVAHYLNTKGQPVPKDKAEQIKIFEYDKDDNLLFTTVLNKSES